MESRPLGAIIKAALIAGLVAGLLVAGFHFVVTEPVMDRAIEIEESLSQVQETTGETLLVDRGVQKAGLFLGFLLYGLTWALLFTPIYHLTQGRLVTMRAPGRGLLLALLTGWSVALFPFLKYPANPPGVGDPETVQYRQILYVALIALSVTLTFLSVALHRYLSRPRSRPYSRSAKWAITLALYVAGAVALYVALPTNSDPIRMPADLVGTFRLLSLAGLALFWVAFGASFACLMWAGGAARRLHRPATARLHST